MAAAACMLCSVAGIFSVAAPFSGVMLTRAAHVAQCQVEGNLVKWERWHIRTSFNYREGLVLHNVCYEDEGRLRPILHRASLVEMAVVSAGFPPSASFLFLHPGC